MIYFQRFYEKYRYGEDEKISDSFHEGINILPFTANPATSNFDNTCSIKGITGEFFRYNSQVPANPVFRLHHVYRRICSQLSQAERTQQRWH